MSSRSQALSKPETIIYDNNIFQKEIRQTGNNYDTTCLDLAMKKLPLNNYISDLGQYNLVNFENNYTPAKTHYYTYTDYSQQCPSGWSNQGGGQCMNWWNYDGPCNAGQWTSGTRNCNWRYNQRTCYYWG
jgi:hypothetical protein